MDHHVIGATGQRALGHRESETDRRDGGAHPPDGTSWLGEARGGTLAPSMSWRQNGAMPSVQIKDVPEETHAVLRRRAAAAHQSLQEYLRSRLIEEAARPTLEEVFDRIAGWTGGSVPFKDATHIIRADRDRR